jgi:hypothetical protein
MDIPWIFQQAMELIWMKGTKPESRFFLADLCSRAGRKGLSGIGKMSYA